VRSGTYFSIGGVFGSALLWLLSFKVVAFWLGPAGVGLYSQLRQIAQAATIGATFGGTNAVVQGLSALEDEPNRQRFRVTASRLIGATGAVVALLILILAPILTQFFLSSGEPRLIASVRWLSFAVLLNVGATYVIAVLNGYRAYRYLALAQITGPLGLALALTAAYFLRINYRPQILVWLFVLCFGITYLVGTWGIVHLTRTFPAMSLGRLTFLETRTFVKFAFSNLLAALSATIALLLIRSWIIESRGLAFAGLFDAGWTLTFNYTTLFLTACSTIYLPLLTCSTELGNQRVCMLKTAYLVLSAGTLVCYLLVMFKTPLIRLLYSREFDAAGNLLVILSIAVILRGVSWVYGMLIVATRDSRILLLSDVLLNLGLVAIVWYCLRNYSTLEALGWAFVIANFIYLVFVIEYALRKNNQMKRRKIWPLVVIAALPLAVNWEQAQWIQMTIGFTVSGVAWFAHKMVLA
jgi:O-antigen/teichoic acid export membrane protein